MRFILRGLLATGLILNSICGAEAKTSRDAGIEAFAKTFRSAKSVQDLMQKTGFRVRTPRDELFVRAHFAQKTLLPDLKVVGAELRFAEAGWRLRVTPADPARGRFIVNDKPYTYHPELPLALTITDLVHLGEKERRTSFVFPSFWPEAEAGTLTHAIGEAAVSGALAMATLTLHALGIRTYTQSCDQVVNRTKALLEKNGARIAALSCEATDQPYAYMEQIFPRADGDTKLRIESPAGVRLFQFASDRTDPENADGGEMYLYSQDPRASGSTTRAYRIVNGTPREFANLSKVPDSVTDEMTVVDTVKIDSLAEDPVTEMGVQIGSLLQANNACNRCHKFLKKAFGSATASPTADGAESSTTR